MITIIKNIARVINILYLTIFYKVFYSEEKEGYMMKKRILPFLVISPIVLPFWILSSLFSSVFSYLNYILEYRSQWITFKDNSKKPTFKQRLAIKLNFQ